MYFHSMAKLSEWYKAEVRKVTSETKDPAEMQKKIQALTTEFQTKAQALQKREASLSPVKATTTSNDEEKSMEFIPVFVSPYYSGPKKHGEPAVIVQVNNKFDAERTSVSNSQKKPQNILTIPKTAKNFLNSVKKMVWTKNIVGNASPPQIRDHIA